MQGPIKTVNLNDGNLSALNLTTSTEVKTGVGRVCKVIANTAGTTAGGIYDIDTTAGANASNLVFATPNTVGIYDLNFPLKKGLAIGVGTGQVVSVLSYN